MRDDVLTRQRHIDSRDWRWETGAAAASSALRARDELSGLARQFAQAAGQNATDLWHWGRAFQDWFEAQWPRPSLVMVGELIGRLSRGKPYGRQWVSRVLTAMARFPEEPRTRLERAEFLAAFYGNTGRRAHQGLAAGERIARDYRLLGTVVGRLLRAGEAGAAIERVLQVHLAADSHVRAGGTVGNLSAVIGNSLRDVSS